MSIYQTIKKYFLFLSVFFVFATSVHLIFLYISEDAVRSPEEGGTINIGFIGTVPNLNPATYGTDPVGDYLLRFLSRSLLRYNVETKQMEGDIANCNLGKNFSEIKCYIKNDALWSDGTSITKEDILATYSMFQNDDMNKTAKKLLEGITITDQGEYIEFSGKADVLVLDMLLYPIIEKGVVTKIKNNSFSVSENLSSGPYVFEKRESDEKTKNEKVSFIKNEQNTKEQTYIQRYIFRFFDDKNELIANKDSLNIVFPNSTIDSLSSPRFDRYEFIFPEYISLFLNSDKINSELRNLLLGSLAEAKFPSLDEKTGMLLKNPFFTDESVLPSDFDATKIEAVMKNIGYFKKEVLASELTKGKVDLRALNEGVSAYFTNPSNKKYFATTKTDILFSGNVPEGVTGVSINGYKLKAFSPKEKKFYYRAALNMGNLKNGENTYNLAFETEGKKDEKETITLFLATTTEEAEAKEKEYAIKLQSEKNNSAVLEQKQTEEKKTLTEKIEPLDSLYYYDKNLKKFSLQFVYTKQTPYMETLATEIARHFKTLGIDVQITPLSTEDLQTIISKGEKQYSMILTGINLGLFDYNIFPFLHSGQAEKGFNFAKLKNITLDILLERLKSSQINSDSLKFIQSQILEILKKENVFVPLYSPHNTFFIDKNLKQLRTAQVLPYSSSLYDIGENMYLKEEFTIKFEGKNIGGLIDWLKKHSPLVNF
ncbi:MAG: ABC transporter substrate-binding protein [Candidatus Gracilibacteria bacterium]|nr:ABC transporter substrate-binding protein [Candidatus Gracilibacteria bacterium]